MRNAWKQINPRVEGYREVYKDHSLQSGSLGIDVKDFVNHRLEVTGTLAITFSNSVGQADELQVVWVYFINGGNYAVGFTPNPTNGTPELVENGECVVSFCTFDNWGSCFQARIF